MFILTTLGYLDLNEPRRGHSNAYGANMLEPRAEVALHVKIDQRWVQIIVERFHIVSPGPSVNID